MVSLPALLKVCCLLAMGLSEAPPHLFWADRLVRELVPRHNSYGGRPTVVEWRGVDGAQITRNRSVCSSFITMLFRRAYGYNTVEIRRWLGRENPQAIDYFQAIASAHRFHRVADVSMIQAGDLLATRHLQPGAATTGHLMLARRRPQSVGACEGPICLYRLEVIDSSRSGHGRRDTRGTGSGAGIGSIQLQATPRGVLVAYRWSEEASSRWRSGLREPVLIGRFCANRCRSADQRDQLLGD